MNASTDTRAPRPIVSPALLLAGTLLVGFSMGRWSAPLAAWIGPALIIRYARDHRGWRGYLLVFAAYILAFSVGFMAMWLGAGWPLPMVAILPVFYGFLWSLPYLADRVVGARLTGFASTLVYPLAATTLEFVNNQTNPIGVWGATGFTQYGNLPLMQLTAVTGMIGITFLMGWFASVANWAWENRGRRTEMLRGMAVFGVVFACVYAYGFLRLNLAPSRETVRVAGITAESARTVGHAVGESLSGAQDPVAVARPLFQSHWDMYLAATAREAQAGAQVIVWPEVAGMAFESEDDPFIARAQEAARQYEIYLAVPLWIWDPVELRPIENKLLVIDPTGAIVMEHIKYGGNIVEGTLLGDGKLQAVDTPFGVLGGVICWDADYPTVIQQVGLNGTGLLLIPSSDWREIDPLHAHMAVFRAIENGTSLVRQTDSGLSIAVDPYGRVLAQTDYFGSTDRSMVAQVPVKHVATLYTAFGRWLDWVFGAAFLSVVVYVIARAMIARQAART